MFLQERCEAMPAGFLSEAPRTRRLLLCAQASGRYLSRLSTARTNVVSTLAFNDIESWEGGTASPQLPSEPAIGAAEVRSGVNTVNESALRRSA